jgi:protein TonB
MSSDGKAVMLSMMLHGLFLCGMYTVGSTFAHTVARPVVIDFTIMDSGGPAPERKEAAVKQPAAPAPKRHAEVREKTVVRKVEKVETPQPAAIDVPRPALEAAGPVPVAAKAPEARPEKVAATPAGESGNKGPAAPVRTASLAPSGGGGSNSAEQARGRYTREHYAYIKELIEKNLSYPPRARKMGWMGRVVVCFQVLKNGRVDKVRIKNSSGYEILDRNVVDTIHEVEPFPRPPEWVELSMPIIYRLD